MTANLLILHHATATSYTPNQQSTFDQFRFDIPHIGEML